MQALGALLHPSLRDGNRIISIVDLGISAPLHQAHEAPSPQIDGGKDPRIFKVGKQAHPAVSSEGFLLSSSLRLPLVEGTAPRPVSILTALLSARAKALKTASS